MLRPGEAKAGKSPESELVRLVEVVVPECEPLLQAIRQVNPERLIKRCSNSLIALVYIVVEKDFAILADYCCPIQQ